MSSIKSPIVKSAREFDALLCSMSHGQALVYHEGLLMRDRQTDDNVNAIALRAWRAHEAGVVALVQGRLGPGVCGYLAVKL